MDLAWRNLFCLPPNLAVADSASFTAIPGQPRNAAPLIAFQRYTSFSADVSSVQLRRFSEES
jgi:hypothetical protein